MFRQIAKPQADAGETVWALVAEDEFLIRFDFAETMRDLGWQVFEAPTADDGIALIASGIPFDLILTDVNMPGKASGLELARMARRHRPAAKIALMSGVFRPDIFDEDLFDVFMSKPILNLTAHLQPLVMAAPVNLF